MQKRTIKSITIIGTILSGIYSGIQIYNQGAIMNYIDFFLNHAGIVLFLIGLFFILGFQIKWHFDSWKENLINKIKDRPEVIDQLVIHKFVCRLRDKKEIVKNDRNCIIKDTNIESEKKELLNNSELSSIYTSMDKRIELIEKYYKNIF